MDHTQDLYAILGIAAGARTEDIKASYRAAARRFHPDVNSNPGAALQFRDIAAAHEILSDDAKRQSYDTMRQRLASEPQFFTVTVTPSKRVLPILPEPQVVYVVAQIIPNKEVTSKDRKTAPLNLVLVLDRSKSMRGQRLDRVKFAAHQIIDQLGENDFLSVISFSDRADALIESQHVTEKSGLKAIVNTISADGGTEIAQGLGEAMRQVQKNLTPDYVNHIILITDGETYDDKAKSLELADAAALKGIGISTMGIGHEWNDVFLDDIASKTGGSTTYINSPAEIVRFLNGRVRSLGSSFAERLTLTIAPDPDVTAESVFRLTPHPQPVDISSQPIQLGALEATRPITLLIQLQLAEKLKPEFRTMLRLDVTGDILAYKRKGFKVITDLSIEVSETPPPEEPPRLVLDALGKLTLYRMQQKAEAAIKAGKFDEATRRLENLATRLLAAGHNELAQTAITEARRVQQTRGLSEEGRMTMKFGTRLLLADEAGAPEATAGTPEEQKP